MATNQNCYITIDNTRNRYDLVLSEIVGQSGIFSPALIEGTTTVPANQTFSFSIDAAADMISGAKLIWNINAGTLNGNNNNASVMMLFQNGLSDNIAVLKVNGNSPEAQMAYGGVCYLYAAVGNPQPAMRDAVPAANGNNYPLYVTYNIVRNAFVDDPATNFLPNVKHVVMLMLENRSLDHLMGQLYTESNKPAVVFPKGSSVYYDGLGDNPTFSNTDSSGKTVTAYPLPFVPDDPTKGPYTPDPDPGEYWEDVTQQIFNSKTSASGPATMGGFLNNYWFNESQIMGFYTSGKNGDLPVISGLAAEYAVSDAWFCSVPSQTDTNRAFSIAGTASGIVNNPSTPFEMRTMFNVLSDSGDNDWAIFYQDIWLKNNCWTAYQFVEIVNDPLIDQSVHQQPLANFLTAAANGTLPAFSYMEPAFYDGPFYPNGTDYHPPAYIGPGEAMLSEIYNALTSNAEAWANTLFIVTFDEHGGTFDHVVPPATIAPDQQVYVSSNTGYGTFYFNRLGVRVPTLFISPLIQNGMVFRSPTDVPFDHTSFIKTILGWRGIDISGGVMGARAVQAPDFSPVLSATAVNAAVRTFTPGPISKEVQEAMADRPLNDLQVSFLGALAHSITGGKPGSDEHMLVWNELKSVKTLRELRGYVTKAKAERNKL